MENKKLMPNFLFEVSWEVCNKVGGIYTVLSTKAYKLEAMLGSQYILIGPDIVKDAANERLFIQDDGLYHKWVKKAREDGLKIRIGRWQIKGNPITILVDFRHLFDQRDKIFTDLWIKYKLDSLYGGWDYIEPALFGYEAGKVIHHFYEHHVTAQDKIVANFHEWLTGAGILYLEDKVPQVGTAFTTHATTLGRTIAGNG
ncbi:MAG: alpha-glucan family phosphorylase, partial [Bacteroidales bacterium]